LENIVMDTGRPRQNRNTAFSLLVLAALRGRFSDGQNAVDWSVEDETIVARVSQTKTSRLDHSRLPLYLVGPRLLFTQQDWFMLHSSQREIHGIQLGTYPLVPAFDGTCWSDQPACVADFNEAVRSLCRAEGIEQAELRSSHSSKPSLLTFAATMGIADVSRTKLGYHMGPGETRTSRAYDRSRLAEPVAELVHAIAQFSAGEGGRLVVPTLLAEESSESEPDPVEPEDESLFMKRMDSRRLLNTFSNMVHGGRFGVRRKTACGKLIRPHYLDANPVARDAVLCSNCFSKGLKEYATSSDSSD